MEEPRHTDATSDEVPTLTTTPATPATEQAAGASQTAPPPENESAPSDSPASETGTDKTGKDGGPLTAEASETMSARAQVPTAAPSVTASTPEDHRAPTSPDAGPATSPKDLDEEPSILPWIYLPASAVQQPLWWQCLAFVWLFLAVMFVMCMVLTATTWRYPDPNTQHQLPDIALDILPRVREVEHVTDLLLGVLVALCFATVFLLVLVGKGKYTPLREDLLAEYGPKESTAQVAWIRFFVCFTAVTALRIVVVGSTVLPATNNQCKTRPDTGNFWWNSLIGVLSFGGSNVHCGDLLFSGHTAVITLAALAAWQYGPIVVSWFRPLSAVLVVATWFTILLSRSHYTDDIVVALYISVTLWILTPHNPRGAPPVWQLFIQSPLRVYRKYREANDARNARLAATPSAVTTAGA